MKLHREYDRVEKNGLRDAGIEVSVLDDFLQRFLVRKLFSHKFQRSLHRLGEPSLVAKSTGSFTFHFLNTRVCVYFLRVFIPRPLFLQDRRLTIFRRHRGEHKRRNEDGSNRRREYKVKYRPDFVSRAIDDLIHQIHPSTQSKNPVNDESGSYDVVERRKSPVDALERCGNTHLRWTALSTEPLIGTRKLNLVKIQL